MTRTSTQQYTYNTQPHSAPRPGTLDNSVPLTMMSDPRVVRGNTYSLARKIAKERTERSSEEGSPGRIHSSHERHDAVRMPTYQFTSRPFALDGMDLTQYLVDQAENEVIPTRLCETQTDEFSTLPPPQVYIPIKTGVDKETQVDDVTELFNFDEESVPLVEVIVKKTLEQALVEVNHEQELIELQNQMEEFDMQRKQELEWMKQQEDSVVQDYLQVRGVVEKMQQQLKRSREVKAKIAGLQMVRQILPHTIHHIMSTWVTPEEQELNNSILPSILSAVTRNSTAFYDSNEIVNEILNKVLEDFESIPLPKKQDISSLKKVSVRLVKVQQEDVPREDNGNDDSPPPETRDVQTVLAVLSLPIDPTDSVQSLEFKLRQMLASLRTPPSALEATETEEAPGPPSIINDWYPTFIPLYSGISDIVRTNFYERQNLPYIPIAVDAQLSFFPLDIESVVLDHNLA